MAPLRGRSALGDTFPAWDCLFPPVPPWLSMSTWALVWTGPCLRCTQVGDGVRCRKVDTDWISGLYGKNQPCGRDWRRL